MYYSRKPALNTNIVHQFYNQHFGIEKGFLDQDNETNGKLPMELSLTAQEIMTTIRSGQQQLEGTQSKLREPKISNEVYSTWQAILGGVTVVTLTHTTDSFLVTAVDIIMQVITSSQENILRQFNVIRKRDRPYSTEKYSTWGALFGVVTRTLTHLTDSLLKATLTVIHTTDSLLKITNILTHTTDSLLKATLTILHTTDSLLKATQSRTHTTDSLLKFVQILIHTTDSLLKKTQELTHSTDSFVGEVAVADKGGGIIYHKRRKRGLDSVIITPTKIFESVNSEVIGKALIKKHITGHISQKTDILNPIDITKETKVLTLIDRKTEKTFTKGYMPFWSTVTTKARLVAKHYSQSIKKSDLEVERNVTKSTEVKSFDVIHILRLIDKLRDVRKKKGKTPI